MCGEHLILNSQEARRLLSRSKPLHLKHDMGIMYFQKYLGPSQVHTALGYNKYEEPTKLKQKIEKGYDRKTVCSIYTELGKKYELDILKLYYKEQRRTTKQPIRINKAKFAAVDRLGGFADGIVHGDPEGVGGVEIKCQFTPEEEATSETHFRPNIKLNYRLQAICYMFLYNLPWWDIVCCKMVMNCDNHPISCNVEIERLYWKSYKEQWYTYWYPQLLEFIEDTEWQRKL